MSLLESIKSGKIPFNELQKMEITPRDIREFADDYEYVLSLVKQYRNSITNRYDIAMKIVENLVPLEQFIFLFKDKNHHLASYYANISSQLSNPRLAIEVLLGLANLEKEDYAIKSFNTIDFSIFKVDKDSRELGGNILLLAKKEVFSFIDDEGYYFRNDFDKIASSIFNKGYSLVIVTDHGYQSIVSKWKINTPKNNSLESSGNLYYYLQGEDSLTTAVNTLVDFIFKNGGDLNSMDKENLLEVLVKQQKGNSDTKQYTLKKGLPK